MQWFYVIDNQRQGPIPTGELRTLVNNRKITPQSLVWREGMAEWAPLRTAFAEPQPLEDGSVIVACPTCGQLVPPDDLIPAGDTKVCPFCRDRYAQSLREGVAPVFAAGDGPSGTGGATPNHELRAHARRALAGNWTPAVVCTLLFILLSNVMGAILPLIGILAELIITGPLLLGYLGMYQRIRRLGRGMIEDLFKGFSRFGHALGLYLLTTLIIYLAMAVAALPGGVLLFTSVIGAEEEPSGALFFIAMVATIVPAFIASTYVTLHFALVYFISNDNPGTGIIACMKQSSRTMQGRKMKLFLLFLSFIGWHFLTIFTFFIGLLWTLPYMFTAFAAFYEDLADPA